MSEANRIAVAKYRANDPERTKQQNRDNNTRRRSRADYRAKVKDWQKIWRNNNPDKVFDQRFRAVLACYCMTLDDYNALLKEQGGVCAVCGRPPKEKRLVVDHDHNCCPKGRTCGKCTRGLVHSKCNTALGLLDDNLETIEKASNYLKIHKEKAK